MAPLDRIQSRNSNADTDRQDKQFESKDTDVSAPKDQANTNGAGDPNKDGGMRQATDEGRPGSDGAQDGGPITPAEQKGAEAANDRAKEGYQVHAEAAMNGDAAARDSFAKALTKQNLEQLSNEEQQKIDVLIEQVANGQVDPSVIASRKGRVDTNAALTLLPRDTAGAFVPGEPGEAGTILISRDRIGKNGLDDVARQEFGEAIAQRARHLGVGVAEGDAGKRLEVALEGEDPTTRPELYDAKSYDTVDVKLDGTIVKAKAAAPQDLASSNEISLDDVPDINGDGDISEKEVGDYLEDREKAQEAKDKNGTINENDTQGFDEINQNNDNKLTDVGDTIDSGNRAQLNDYRTSDDFYEFGDSDGTTERNKEVFPDSDGIDRRNALRTPDDGGWSAEFSTPDRAQVSVWNQYTRQWVELFSKPNQGRDAASANVTELPGWREDYGEPGKEIFRVDNTETGEKYFSTDPENAIVDRAPNGQRTYFEYTDNSDYDDVVITSVKPGTENTFGPVQAGLSQKLDEINPDFPEFSLGGLPTDLKPEDVAEIPTDAEEKQIETFAQDTFMFNLRTANEGSNAKTFYNLLVARNLVNSGEYSGTVDTKALNADIQYYSGSEDVLQLQEEAEAYATSSAWDRTGKGMADEAVEKLTSKEVRTAVLSMSEGGRQKFIADATRKLQMIDQGASLDFFRSYAEGVFDGITSDDITSRRLAVTSEYYRKQRAGEEPNAEETTTKDEMQKSATDTFSTWLTASKLTTSAGKTVTTAIKTYFSKKTPQAFAVLASAHQSRFGSSKTSYPKAFNEALVKFRVDPSIINSFDRAARLSKWEARLGGIGAVMSVIGAGLTIPALAGKKELTPNERLTVASTILGTAGGLSSFAEGFLKTLPENIEKTTANLGAASNALEQKAVFETAFAGYREASVSLAFKEARLRNLEGVVNPADPLEPTAQEVAARESVMEARAAREVAKGRAVDARNLYAETRGVTRQQLANDSRYTLSEIDAILEDPEAFAAGVASEAGSELVPGNVQLYEELGEVAAPELVEAQIAKTAWYKSSKAASTLKYLGVLGEAASIGFGIADINQGVSDRSDGKTSLGNLEIARGAFFTASGAVGVGALAASFAGATATAAILGPVGLAMLGIGLVISIPAFIVAENTPPSARETTEAEKSFINGTGSGHEYASD